LDVHKAPHVSSFWAYAGIDVWQNPETGERVGRNNHSEQLVDREYIDKNGVTKTRKSVTYNPEFRSKMLGVLGDSFVKHGKQYREVYDRAKYKYANYRDWNKLHVHRAAIRVAVREFLRDLWTKWRELEGYPPEVDWNEANRERVHGTSDKPEEFEVKVNEAGELLPPNIDKDFTADEIELEFDKDA
jgi:hypothetical protein